MPDFPIGNDTLGRTVLWFERAVPEPSTKNIHTQLGCHFEEVAEMLESLEGRDAQTQRLLIRAEVALKQLAAQLKARNHVIFNITRIDLLDALCDQIVTATGVGHMLGFQVQPALDEVNRSNWSKFDDQGQPIFDADRKIQKGPNYSKADLKPFVP